MNHYHYRSEAARAGAVYKFALISWLATLFTYGLLTIVCLLAGILNIYLVLLLIVGQSITWGIMFILLAATFDSLDNPPTPKEKTPKDLEIVERIIPVYTRR